MLDLQAAQLAVLPVLLDCNKLVRQVSLHAPDSVICAVDKPEAAFLKPTRRSQTRTPPYRPSHGLGCVCLRVVRLRQASPAAAGTCCLKPGLSTSRQRTALHVLLGYSAGRGRHHCPSQSPVRLCRVSRRSSSVKFACVCVQNCFVVVQRSGIAPDCAGAAHQPAVVVMHCVLVGLKNRVVRHEGIRVALQCALVIHQHGAVESEYLRVAFNHVVADFKGRRVGLQKAIVFNQQGVVDLDSCWDRCYF